MTTSRPSFILLKLCKLKLSNVFQLRLIEAKHNFFSIRFRHVLLVYLILSLSWNLFAKIHMKCKKGSVGHQELQREMDMSVPRIQRRYNPAICGDMIAPCLLWILFISSTAFAAIRGNWPYDYMTFIGGFNVAITVICPLTMIMTQPVIKEHFRSSIQYLRRDQVQPIM